MHVRKVLVVDNDERVRVVAQAALTAVTEWDIVVASSGFEGVQVADTECPDVILLAASMPEMDGEATLARLQQQNGCCSEIPVIFLASPAGLEETDRFLELGAAGVIVKPFDPLTLADEVRSILS
jgi:CheY-like chemotaxis protein